MGGLREFFYILNLNDLLDLMCLNTIKWCQDLLFIFTITFHSIILCNLISLHSDYGI